MQHVMKRPSVHRTPHGAYQTLQHYVADLIYGTNDGILTTFAIVAGVSGGDLSSSAVLSCGGGQPVRRRLINGCRQLSQHPGAGKRS